ncbi:MAG: endonuclease/exonuclease/phosphatase family protein [Bacteroidetes bacterium]|nr:MAG: endonuclease/exonuclease/phosphatase family protein [Bacteroidota bacterium]
MKSISYSIFLLVFTLCSFQGFSQQNKKNYYTTIVGFYNLENLFDTIDNPDTRDEEYLPEGKNGWTSERYWEKIGQMSRVISEIGTDVNPDGPAILGISEIENKEVVEDLVKSEKLKARNYGIVHYNSPDRRGVDVGLIYQPKYFKVTNSKSVTLKIEGEPDFYTRDQLVVSGLLDGEPVHIIVGHWPSRRGGEKRSAPKRIAAAKLGRQIIDSLYEVDPTAKIIYMGDLNDDPTNASVRRHIKTTTDKNDTVSGRMYNPMQEMYRRGIGSLAYRDNWNLFDQTMLSNDFMKKDYSSFRFYGARVFNKTYLMQPEGRYKGYPMRTFSGGIYTGGFSDHFPVYVVLVKEKK